MIYEPEIVLFVPYTAWSWHPDSAAYSRVGSRDGVPLADAYKLIEEKLHRRWAGLWHKTDPRLNHRQYVHNSGRFSDPVIAFVRVVSFDEPASSYPQRITY